MPEWNPVAGMEEISVDDIRDGDVIIQYLDRSYTEYTCVNGMTFSKHGKYYLLSREIREPEGRGDLADIYFTDSGEVVQTLIRTRPKFEDDIGGDYISPWTDDSNNTVMDWASIMNKVEENEEYSLRTYTASYKEN